MTTIDQVPSSVDQPSSIAPQTDPINQLLTPMIMLTLWKGPSQDKSCENNIRRSICFDFLPSKNYSNHRLQQRSYSHLDRPRVVTNWKSESETQREFLHSLEPEPANSLTKRSLSPSTPISASSPASASSLHHSHHSGERVEPLNLKSIPDEILLPFDDREQEVFDLLTEERNAALYNRLKAVLGQSSNWSEFENSILRAPRDRIGDRQWAQVLQSTIQPLDSNLWVAFRGLIGADGLDQQTELSVDHDWLIQPVKIRRRSAESARRTSCFHNRSQSDSFISVFAESDQESAISQSPKISQSSPRAFMESIKEQDVSEFEPPEILQDSPGLQSCSDSGDDEFDPAHGFGLKILQKPPSPPEDSSKVIEVGFRPSHGLKYSFGHVTGPGLGLQSV